MTLSIEATVAFDNLRAALDSANQQLADAAAAQTQLMAALTAVKQTAPPAPEMSVAEYLQAALKLLEAASPAAVEAAAAPAVDAAPAPAVEAAPAPVGAVEAVPAPAVEAAPAASQPF